MSARPHFLRGYSNDWANTQPAVTLFDGHRVIHLERDYWVSEAELSDLAAEDALAYRTAQAVLFWVCMAAVGGAFAVLAWFGVIPS